MLPALCLYSAAQHAKGQVLTGPLHTTLPLPLGWQHNHTPYIEQHFNELKQDFHYKFR